MNFWVTKNGYRITLVVAGRSNVFLLQHNGINILVDTSTKRNRNKLNQSLRSLGINTLDYLVLTHTHHDHAANAAQIKKMYNSTVIVHQHEAYFLEQGKAILPQGTNFFTKTLINLFGKKVEHKFNFEPCKHDIVFNSCYDFKHSGLNIFCLHTPGHSPGSISIIIDNEIAIVGDTLFGIFRNGVFPPFADNPYELMSSWEKLLNTKCKLFLPAHGRAIDSDLLKKNFQRKVTV